MKPLPPSSIGLSIQFHAGNYKTSSIKSKCHKNLNLNFTNHNIDLEGHKLTGLAFSPKPSRLKVSPFGVFLSPFVFCNQIEDNRWSLPVHCRAKKCSFYQTKCCIYTFMQRTDLMLAHDTIFDSHYQQCIRPITSRRLCPLF